MLAISPFDAKTSEQRRLTEPQWRHFPSLMQTFPAKKAGFLDILMATQDQSSQAGKEPIASAVLEKFFAEKSPQSQYPYVWVKNAVNPIPDHENTHEWLHEVWVSYTAEDMPVDAPIRFAEGKLLNADVDRLRFGKTTRYDAANRDVVRQFCAYAHIACPADSPDEMHDAEASAPSM